MYDKISFYYSGVYLTETAWIMTKISENDLIGVEKILRNW